MITQPLTEVEKEMQCKYLKAMGWANPILKGQIQAGFSILSPVVLLPLMRAVSSRQDIKPSVNLEPRGMDLPIPLRLLDIIFCVYFFPVFFLYTHCQPVTDVITLQHVMSITCHYKMTKFFNPKYTLHAHKQRCSVSQKGYILNLNI